MIFIIVVSVIIIFLWPKLPGNIDIYSEEEQYNSGKITGKLKTYIEMLGDNYYIRYSGNFYDQTDTLVKAIIDYTKKGSDFAIKSTELNVRVVYNKQVAYTMSDRYKLIATVPVSSIDIKDYNLASDIGQEFVKQNRETINGQTYDIEEYVYNNNVLKYYFDKSELKIIKFNDNEIRIMRYQKKVNNDLFEIPNDYERL